ncbi:anti-sigma factor [Roseivirga pacifica]
MKKQFLTLGLAALFLVACNDDDAPSEANLNLSINGLEDLGSSAQYEGWLIVDGAPISTGVFTVTDGGNLSQSAFSVDAANAANATKFVLTVEPIPDTDPAPSAQKLLAGDIANGQAALSTGVAPALGAFENASGKFFLRTPTDETDGNNGNDQFGVWFGNPGTPPTSGLDLPVLPEGWVYEGWVIGEAGPITTGRFTAFDEMDESNAFSGTENNAGPPIPGEDFFNNAPAGENFPLDLRGRTVVITVEPEPDNGAEPFLLKPLIANLPVDAATAPATHDLTVNQSGIPTGQVTIN